MSIPPHKLEVLVRKKDLERKHYYHVKNQLKITSHTLLKALSLINSTN